MLYRNKIKEWMNEWMTGGGLIGGVKFHLAYTWDVCTCMAVLAEGAGIGYCVMQRKK